MGDSSVVVCTDCDAETVLCCGSGRVVGEGVTGGKMEEKEGFKYKLEVSRDQP